MHLRPDPISKVARHSFIGLKKSNLARFWLCLGPNRIQLAFERAGIRLLDNDTGGGTGVRLSEQKKLDDAAGRCELLSDALG